MRAITYLLRFVALALVLCLSAVTAAAQSTSRLAGIAVTDDLPLSVTDHIEQGDKWLGEREYSKARAEYEAAVDILREQGEFPMIPLRRIADSYYLEGDYPAAIHALDELAEEAATYGDLVTEAWAMIDAAWVMGRECFGRTDRRGFRLEIHQRIDQVKRLLESPYLPDEVRAEITAKRCDGCHDVEPADRREFTCYASDGL